MVFKENDIFELKIHDYNFSLDLHHLIIIKLSTNIYSREILLNDYPVFPEQLMNSGFVFKEKSLENYLSSMN